MIADEFDDRRNKPKDGYQHILPNDARDGFEIEYRKSLASLIHQCILRRDQLRGYSVEDFHNMLNVESVGMNYRQVHELTAIVYAVVQFRADRKPCAAQK